MFISQVYASTTTPNVLIYEGKLLDSSNTAISTAHVFRLSLWSSSDFIPNDIDITGVINIAAVNYGGWQEEQIITPNSDGTYSIQLGDINALPEINYNKHKYLQVEIKKNGTANTSYQLMDPTSDDGADANDRQIIGSSAYSKNADMLDNAIDANITAAGNVELSFGDFLLNQILEWDPDGVAIGDGWFNFTDDVNIQGNLTVTGTINGSSSGLGILVGITVANSDGNITSGGKIGYEAANTICDNEYAGSHICTTDEIANTISNTTNLNTVFNTGQQGWVFEGAPGFTSNSNDCNGWTRNDNVDYYGAFWLFDTNGGGAGWLSPCSNIKPLTCCK